MTVNGLTLGMVTVCSALCTVEFCNVDVAGFPRIAMEISERQWSRMKGYVVK